MDTDAKRLAELNAKKQAAARKKTMEEKLRRQQANAALKEQLENETQPMSAQDDRAAIELAARAWIESKIKPKVEKYRANISGRSCIIRVKLYPGGQVEAVKITESSGDDSFDQSVIASVRKASPFQWPDDEKIAHELRSFQLRVKSK